MMMTHRIRVEGVNERSALDVEDQVLVEVPQTLRRRQPDRREGRAVLEDVERDGHPADGVRTAHQLHPALPNADPAQTRYQR